MKTTSRLAIIAGLFLLPSADAQEAKELIAAVNKLNGYTSTDKTESERPVLRIQFRSPGPRDADLKTLRPLLESSPVPVGLNLNQCYDITDAGVANVEKIATLRSLSLGNTKVTDAGLKHVATLTNLEELYLASENLTDSGLEQLADLTNLRKLSVYSKKVTDDGYKHLAKLTKLEEIHVGDIGLEVGDTCLNHMKGMTKLRKLGIGRTKLTDAGMAHVKNFTELVELRIEGEKVTAAGLKNLSPLVKVKKLTIMSCPAINSDAMSAIKDMAALEELEIIYCGAIKPEASARLKGLTNLKKLRFDSVTNEGLSGISGLKKLEELQLFYTYIEDEGIKHLAGLTGLKRLSLMQTRVTDAGLKHLSGLSELRELGLGNTKVTGDGLQHLAGLKNLKDLSLSECKVTDAGLKHLAGATSLEELSLSGCPITDAGLVHLKSLTNLRNLNLTGTKVNDDAVLALKKDMPKTRIRDIVGDEVTLEKRPTRPKPAVEDLTKAKPDFTLTADQYFKDFKDDRGAADRKYKNKVIELSGVVSGMGHNISEEAYLSLQAEKDLIGVMCVMADESPFSKVVPGQKVKIKGKCPELAFGAAIVACVITEADKSPAIRKTAQELANEYKKDSKATTEKYKDKYVILTGEIIDREFNSVGAASIQLKVDGDVKVKCSFTAFEKSQTRKLKVGQKVTVVGQYTLNFGDEEVGIFFCHVLDQK